MEVSVFVDETGDILNSNDARHFGFGFCYCPDEFKECIEAKLKKEGLDTIHFVNKEYAENIELANRLSSLNLQDIHLRGGALIQPSKHYEEFLLEQYHKNISENPFVFLSMAKQHRSSRHLKENELLDIKQVYPQIYSDARLTVFLTLVSKFAALPAVSQYGQRLSKVRILVSSISDLKTYKKKIAASQVNMEKQALIFLEKLYLNKVLPSNPKEHMKIEFEVIDKSDGLFGVADLFGATAHHLFRGTLQSNHTIGAILHDSLSSLFFELGMLKDWEIKKGVLFFNQKP